MKRLIRSILLPLIAAAILFPLCAPVWASGGDGETVRVGYFDLGSYYTQGADGSMSSYDAAFLGEIAKYTGYNFEYVDCGTWDNALAMLRDHEIDLVGTMQWTAEREAEYEICDASYGYSVAELAALESSDYIYEDYAALSGARVGCIGGYVIMEQLHNLTERKGLSLTVSVYDSQTKLDQALENGEIDLVAANAHAVHEDWKIVEKFAYAPFYFASWKGNSALTEDISAAIIQIHVYQSGFADSLIKEYFPRLVRSPYTKEELECVGKNEIYSVYFDGTTAPLVWYDEADGNMKGVLVDICEQLSQQTGLSIQVKQRTEASMAPDSSTVTYRTLNYTASADARDEAGVTDALLDQEFEMYHRIGRDYTEGNAYKIAAVANRDGLKEYLADFYPNCEIAEYASPEECLRALAGGEVDLAFLNTNVAENLIITNNWERISVIPMTSVTFGIALQFHGEDAEALAKIVDKGLQLVDEDKITNALVSYAMNTKPNTTLFYLIKQHVGLTVCICVTAVLLLVALAIMFTYTKVERRQRMHVEQANQARTDFFARMSHDMRTPMNGILGMARLSEEETDAAVLRDNLAKIETSGEYMLSLINDTLDLQRLESGKMKFNLQIVEAASFFRSIPEMLQASAEQKGVQFNMELINVPEKSFLLLDPVRVKQILNNLTSNSIKFTPENGVIRILIERTTSDDKTEHYRFCVQDSGVGMSAEFMEKNLFQAYAQEHNEASDQYSGSGLGLAITKNIVELMGGRISVESELGEGSAFTVELGFERIERSRAFENMHSRDQQAQKEKRALAGKRVLLAEDHPLNAEIAKRLLKRAGCTVEWAENGVKAVEKFQQSEPGYFDAILMDIRMPLMDGLEAAEKLRALERGDAKTVPIIAMSANAFDEDKRKSISAGMNAHLGKPVEPELLYETLAEFMG